MHRWLKRTMLVCGIFITVWVGIAMYWNTSNRLPTSSDVMIYLGLVPVGLVLATWLSMKILAEATVKPDAASSTANSREGVAPPSLESQETRNELIILSSSIRATHGQSADELAQALASNKARPILDGELTDSNGYPILSGRIQTVEEEVQQENMTKWIAAHQLPETGWSAEQLRALALGSAALSDLLPQVTGHPLLPAYHAAEPAKRPFIALPILQLHSVLPLLWDEEQRYLATEWFKYLIEQQGWPSEKICARQTSPANRGQPLLMLEQLAFQADQQASPCFSLLIACESHIGEQTVLDWERTGKLLSGEIEAGLIPSEGAAGFLFSDAQHANQMKADGLAKAHRPFQSRREKSADSSGRISAEALTELVRTALGSAAIPAEKIDLIAADTDHRASRAGELIAMVHAAFPDLDLKTQCYKVGAACGFAGAVSSLTALALAHHAAVNNGGPALCISNQDKFECSAIVVSPLADELTSLPTSS